MGIGLFQDAVAREVRISEGDRNEDSAGPEIGAAAFPNSGGRGASSDDEMQVSTVKQIARSRNHIEENGVLDELAVLDLEAVGKATVRMLRNVIFI